MSRPEELEDVEWGRDAASQRLLDAERRADMQLPSEVVERALRRTQASLGAAPSRDRSQIRRWLKIVGIGTVVVAIGGGYGSSRAPRPMTRAAQVPTVVDERPTAPEPPASPQVHEIDVAALPTVPARAPAPKEAKTPPAHAERAGTDASRLAEERALIVQTRQALGQRNFSEASRLLARHESEYPHGQFVDQRKALRVWLSRDQGMNDQADREADQFKAENPGSLMGPSLGAGK